jgi:ring-1,2-phenylacetyl-CoA epoxidase subunit PaaC
MKDQLIKYILHLGDDTLILGHRNSEWCGHGPVLEQDIAITNISLDLIGQARYFYQYAAQLKADGSTEDSLAYLRKEREFKNCLLTEQPNGDWAKTILRQFFFSAYQQLLYQQLENSRDEQLAAIAAKSLKEVNYHLRWSSEWVVRLGDGTEESNQRMRKAINELWMYTGELFAFTDYELKVKTEGTGSDLLLIKPKWEQRVKEVFEEATLPVPEGVFQHVGGKEGKHTEYLGYILAELQFMQRAYPGCEW